MLTKRRERLAPAVLAGAAAAAAPASIESGFGKTPEKPGPLDDDEYAAIKKHADAGNRLLSELGGFPRSVRRLVRDHHERLDGTGYPNGLSADQIDLETRILAVCDVYDALVSDRVYRRAWSQGAALDLLHREAGTAFDERCVAALERVVAGAPVELEAAAGLAARFA